jgi:hypothetical protein
MMLRPAVQGIEKGKNTEGGKEWEVCRRAMRTWEKNRKNKKKNKEMWRKREMEEGEVKYRNVNMRKGITALDIYSGGAGFEHLPILSII